MAKLEIYSRDKETPRARCRFRPFFWRRSRAPSFSSLWLKTEQTSNDKKIACKKYTKWMSEKKVAATLRKPFCHFYYSECGRNVFPQPKCNLS